MERVSGILGNVRVCGLMVAMALPLAGCGGGGGGGGDSEESGDTQSQQTTAAQVDNAGLVSLVTEEPEAASEQAVLEETAPESQSQEGVGEVPAADTASAADQEDVVEPGSDAQALEPASREETAEEVSESSADAPSSPLDELDLPLTIAPPGATRLDESPSDILLNLAADVVPANLLPLSAAAPEPASAGLLGLSLLVVLARRPKRLATRNYED